VVSAAEARAAGTRICGGGKLYNYCNAHVFDSEDDEHGVIIEGLTIDHRSQAMDDLSADAVALLDPLEYPEKAASGYGTEAFTSPFSRLYQYAGWPHGDAQTGVARFAIRLRGSRSIVKDCIIIRSHTAAIRFSRTSQYLDPPDQPEPAEGMPDERTYSYFPSIQDCQALNNLIIEPRLTGINFSTNTEGCIAVGNTVINAIQIGITAFTADLAPSNSHVITGNRVVNYHPIGENGIAVEGHIGSTITGNLVEGFGAVGIRAIFSVGGVISGNTVRKIGMQAIQAARYPSDLNGVGIFVHNDATRWTIGGNSVEKTRRYGIVITETDNTLLPNQIKEAGFMPVQIALVDYSGGVDFEYSGTRFNVGRSKATNHVSVTQSMDSWGALTSAPAGVLTVTQGAHAINIASPTNITSIVNSTGSLGFPLLYLRASGAGAITLVHNTASIALKGNVNRVLVSGEAGITLMRRTSNEWVEV